MVVCEFAIQVIFKEDLYSTCRKFKFSDVPRIGETIWIGETLGFQIEDVQYGFIDNETPNVRIETKIHPQSWYVRNKKFLIDWGFPAFEVRMVKELRNSPFCGDDDIELPSDN